MRSLQKFSFNLILLGLFIITSCGTPDTGKKNPSAVKGVIDFSDFNFADNGIANLNGEWEFHWKKFLRPADFHSRPVINNTGYISLPGLWEENVSSGNILSAHGYGTYRLIIKNRPDGEMKALLINDVLSVCRIWINGHPVGETGTVGNKINEEIPRNHILFPRFYFSGDSQEIIIQVSNYHNIQGGINGSLWLGNENDLRSMLDRNRIMIAILGGVLFFMALYHLTLYLIRRQEKTNLYFGLYCLMWSICTMFGDSGIPLMATIVPDLPWRMSIDLSLIPYGVSVPLVIMFYHSLFPQNRCIPIERFFQVIGVAFIIYIILSQPNAFGSIPLLYSIVALTVFFYLFFRLIMDIIRKEPGVWLLALGYFFLILSGIYDRLSDMNIVNRTLLVPYGAFAFILSYSLLISTRFSEAFTRIEELSLDLEEKNSILVKKNRLKDEFLAVTSHELRTPLHGIVGLSESMISGAAGQIPVNVVENLSLIASSGYRLTGLVDDILEMAKLRNNELKLNLKAVDIFMVTEIVVKLSRALIGSKPVIINNRIQPGLPSVFADEDRIKQVLHNLIGNAIKFTSEGTIDIFATVIETDKINSFRNDGASGNMVRILVSDTGIGIPDENLDSIFDLFKQADGSDSRIYPGSGLGLAITKELVELHNGVMEVSSEEGRGSVFSFTLPLANGKESQNTVIRNSQDRLLTTEGLTPDLYEHADKSGDEISFENNPVILVVDDDPVNVQVVMNYLALKNCTVKTASNGLKAIEIIKGNDSIDLVLLDVMMPVISGYEVCRQIRTYYSPEELPVVMLTAKNRVADINAAFDAGANDYIVKPFRIRELLIRINTMLKLKTIEKKKATSITIREKSKTYFFDFDDICYIASHSKNAVIHTKDRDVEISGMLKDITDRLPADLFIRIHKGFIVNLRYILSLSHVRSGRYKVILKDEDDTELPVGSSYLENLRENLR